MTEALSLRLKLKRLLDSGIKNRKEIAARYNLSVSTINRLIPGHLKRTGRYTAGKAIHITQFQKAVIEGGILGDGRLIKNPMSTSFSFSNRDQRLVQWVARKLNRLTSTRRGGRYAQSSPTTVYKGLYRFQTSSTPTLNKLWQRWYRSADNQTLRSQPWRHYRKNIPAELRLTPTSALLWYLGDGSLTQRSSKEHSQVVRLATHDLPYKGLIQVLQPQLAKVLAADVNEIRIIRDARSRYRNYGYEICIPARYVPRWLGYIGQCPVPTLRYKWNYQKGVRKRWLKDELGILCKYWGRIDHGKICKALGVSFNQARTAAKRYCKLGRAYSNTGRPLRPSPQFEQSLMREVRITRPTLSEP